MELTKESMKIFRKTLKQITKELDELRRMSKDNITIPVELKTLPKKGLYEGYYYLALYQDQFVIYGQSYSPFNTYSQNIVFGRRNKFGHVTLAEGTNYGPILMAFMEEYPDVRIKVAKAIELNEQRRVEEAQRKKVEQKKTLERLREIQNRCSNLATIEIQMPQTNNQHEIEIKEENGQKVGTIKINGLTLRIITSGDVKITNDLEKQKTKRR